MATIAPLQPNGQTPASGASRLCDWVQGLFVDARQARNQVLRETQWGEWLQGYWGTLWPETLPSYKAPITVNETKLLILQELSDLTDNSPKIFVTSNRQTGERDQLVEQAIQTYWQNQFVDMTLLEAYADAAIWPCGFLEVVWDELAAHGEGEIQVRARHPQSVYPDPRATSDEDWRYVVMEDVMDTVEVRQHWPETGRHVRPDAGTHDSTQSDQPAWLQGGTLGSPLYPMGSPQPSGGLETGVRVYTCYVRDPTLEYRGEDYKDAEGETHLRRVARYKYPEGRLIQCTRDVLLYEGPNPYKGGFPLIQVKLQPSIHAFWPKQSLVSEVLELQRGSDKLESLVLENALRMNRGIWLIDANAGINPKTFADVPGQVILKRPGAQVTAEYPRPMPPEMLQQGERLREKMREVLGFQRARQGQASQGNVSPELTETEISQSMGLTRLRSRLLLKAVRKLAGRLLLMMAQFYTTTRLIPCVIEEAWQPLVWQPLLSPERYAVHVDPAGFAVVSRSMYKRLVLALAKMNRISNVDLLKELEMPRAKEMADRLGQEQAASAQAKAAQRGPRRR